jgi:hypothetical protein
MVQADASLFAGLGHYWSGMARIQLAELEDREGDGLKEAAETFRLALEQVNMVREREARILAVAQPIKFSAFFVRRHDVISQSTELLRQALEDLVRDLSDGFYPAAACSTLNTLMSRMMASFEYDARVEGVLTRVETQQRRQRDARRAARDSGSGR